MERHKLSYIIILIFLIIFIEGCSKKTIPQLLQPPAPTNLIAEYISSDEIKLTWQDNSDNELGFKIERKKEGEDWTEIATVGENVTTYNDTGLTPVTTYYYRVKAYNSAGDSDYSNEVKIYLPLISTEPGFSLMGFATLGGGTTGGENGEVVYVNTGVDLQKEINKGGPRIIYVNGTITPENTAGKYVIYVKNVSKISIIGIGTSGELNGVGIKINNANNIIIRNLKIHNVKDPNIATQGPDCITIEGPAKNIWIDHCEFYNQFQGIDKDYYDGLLDINGAVDYVTVSWCYFHDSWKTSLIGSSDSDNYNRTITYHHNWFRNCNSRLPSFRFGEGHIFSNYYQDIPGSAINSRMGAKLKIEHNYFENVKNPIGSWDSQEIGFWDIVGNIFIDCSGSIPTTSTCSYTPPYSYTLTPAENVKEIVTQYAGVGKIDF
jgi:pectate lyase